jgi:hypothetical protein
MPKIEITWRDENYGSERHLHAFRVYKGLEAPKERARFARITESVGFRHDGRRACWGSDWNENAAAKLLLALDAVGYEVENKGAYTE